MIANPKFFKKIKKSTSKLVESLTSFESGSENHEACVEYSLSHFQNHKFLDTDSFQVSRRIKRLCEKFIIHNQPEKASILKKLVDSFLSLDLSEDSKAGSQNHYSLLSILLNSSVNPVNREYKEPSPKESEEEEQFDWPKYLLEGEELLYPSQWAWDDTPCTSEEEDEGAPYDVAPTSKTARMQRAANNVLTFEPGRLEAENVLIRPYWKEECDVNHTLNFGEIDNSFQVHINPKMKESNVVREILWLLGGQENLYLFPLVNNVYTVCNDIQLCHMTSSAIQSILLKVAQYGNIIKNLRTFVFSDSYKESQTYQAFSESLLKYLRTFQGELLSLERCMLEQEETMLVSDVFKNLLPRLIELEVLQSVLARSVELDKSHETCAEKVTRLSGQLYNAILDQSHTQQCNSILRSDLVHIWVDSVRPYIDIIDNWISHGTLIDPYGEFVFQRSASVPDVNSDQFWSEAFKIVSTECIQYIDWLKPFLDIIVVAGKSVEVLASLGSCAKNSLEEKSLYTSFVERLSIDNGKTREPKREVHEEVTPPPQTDSLLYLSFEQMFKENTEKPKENEKIEVDERVPFSVILERSFTDLIQDKCEGVKNQLLKVFMKDHNLISVMKKFHHFQLMEWGDIMYDFTLNVFHKISAGEYWEDLMSLRAALQEAISDSKPAEDSSAIAVVLNREKNLPNAHHLISVTDIMELYFKVEWPLNIIITKNNIKSYNLLFGYLLQVKRALFCLENLKFDEILSNDDKEASEKAHRFCLLRSNILRLVSHWHNFIMTSVIQAEKEVFLKRLEDSTDLDSIILAHNRFLDRMCSLCLLKQEKQADKMIQGTLQKIFGLCVVLHTKWNRGLTMISIESLKQHEAQYKECSEFLGIILQNLVSRGAVPLSLEALAFCLMS